MRKEFTKRLHELMQENVDIFLITADLGYNIFDQIREDFPDRFYNTGASEQAASDICVGLALSGKIPFMYTITPFYYRCWETLRTYINHEKLNVKMIASGQKGSYKTLGFSHASEDMQQFLYPLENISKYYPVTNAEVVQLLDKMVQSTGPSFIALKK